MSPRFAHTFVVATAILAFAEPAVFLDAQTDPETGSFTGFVLDPLGNGVTDQTIQLEEITKNYQHPARPNNRHTTRTDSAGRFEFRDLPTGTYQASGQPSFRPVEITIKAGERVEQNLEVGVASVHMSVTVCGECESPMIGLWAVVQSMDEEHYRGEQVLPALLRQPEQFTITYPAALRAAGVEGTVEIEGRVGTDGSPIQLEVLSETHPELNDAVITVLKSSLWTPARVRGVPVVQSPAERAIKSQEAALRVTRFSPAAFPEVPAEIRARMEADGYRVPQDPSVNRPHNVTAGEFVTRGQRDWAAFCSMNGTTSLRIYWGGASRCPALDFSLPDTAMLQGDEFSMHVGTASAQFVTDAGRAHDQKVPRLTHDAIDIGSEKASSAHYCDGRKWIQILTSD